MTNTAKDKYDAGKIIIALSDNSLFFCEDVNASYQTKAITAGTILDYIESGASTLTTSNFADQGVAQWTNDANYISDTSGNLLGVAALTTTGMMSRTGSGTFSTRTITGSADITVTNGDGVSSDPTLSLSNTGVSAGSYGSTSKALSLTISSKGRVEGIAAADIQINQSQVTDLSTTLSGKQDADSDLTTIAGLTPTDDDLLQRKSGEWTNRTVSQVRDDMGLGTTDEVIFKKIYVSNDGTPGIDSILLDASDDVIPGGVIRTPGLWVTDTLLTPSVRLLDQPGGDRQLIIESESGLTADASLTINVDNADRYVQISSDVTLDQSLSKTDDVMFRSLDLSPDGTQGNTSIGLDGITGQLYATQIYGESVLSANGGLGIKSQAPANYLFFNSNEALTGDKIISITVDDANRRIDLSGDLDINAGFKTGSHLTVLGTTGSTSIILPTSGTLATLSGSETLSNKTLTNIVSLDGLTIKNLILGLDTGTFTGGALSLNADTTKFDVTAGSGVIVNATDPTNPTYTTVSWGAQTGITATNIGTSNLSVIYVDSTGTIQQSSTILTPAQRRTRIVLGGLLHPTTGSVIQYTLNLKAPAFYSTQNFIDLTSALGTINITGNVFSANGANLLINKSAGSVFAQGQNFNTSALAPNNLTCLALTAPSFTYLYNNSSLTAALSISATQVNPDIYDTLTGATGTVSNSKYTIQKIWYYPSTNTVSLELGQAQYSSMSEAYAAIYTSTSHNWPVLAYAIFRGWLIVKKGTTALNNSADAYFVPSDKFGSEQSGAGATAGTDTLQTAYNNSTSPQITTTSTLGAVTVRNGAAADTDTVFKTQNIAGTDRLSITGAGDVTLANMSASSVLATDSSNKLTTTSTLATNLKTMGTYTGTSALSITPLPGVTTYNDYIMDSTQTYMTTVKGLTYRQGENTSTYYTRLGYVGSNNGAFRISGILSNYTPALGKCNINLLFSRRDGFLVTGTALGTISTADIEAYADGSNNITLYLKTATYAEINLDLAIGGAPSSTLNVSVGTPTTTTPTGTLVFKLGTPTYNSTNITDGVLRNTNTGLWGIGQLTPESIFHVYTNSTSTARSGGIVLSQNGTGDARLTLEVYGSTSAQFTHGWDQSANNYAEALSAVLGTSNIRTVSTDGHNNYPKQASFSAYLNASVTNATGGGTPYTIVFNTESYDQGSNFSGGTFTAPIAGKYLFNFSCLINSLTASYTNGYIILSVTRSAVETQYIFNQINIGAARNPSNNAALQGSKIINLIANDTVVVKVLVSGGTDVLGITGSATSPFYTSFEGCLLH